MDFDVGNHLRNSLELSGIIRETVEPLVGSYEDRQHPVSKTGDTTFEIDVPVEEAVGGFFKDNGINATVMTEDQGILHYGGGTEAIYLIDPLDGSRNARRGLPAYSCSIAVFPPGAETLEDVAVGVVSRLDTDDDYTVVAGDAARSNGKTITASGKKDLTHAVLSIGCHFAGAYGIHDDLMLRLAEATGSGVDDVWLKCYGSTALELAFLASGKTDLIVDLRAGAGLAATPKTYDVAAGLLLCRESGAEVSYGSDSIPQPLPVDPTVKVQLVGAGSSTLFDQLTGYL
ncbi:MAG: inositol monophosphatase family protein [Candidatus Altiarchaeota archaeon]